MPCKANDKKTCKTKNTKTAKKDEQKDNGMYRVSYDSEIRKWVIKRDGADRVIDSKVTKEEALKRVKDLSKKKDVGFTVQKKDGKFQKIS